MTSIFTPFEALAGVTLAGDDLADIAAPLQAIARSPLSLDEMFTAANLDGWTDFDDSDTLAMTFRPLP